MLSRPNCQPYQPIARCRREPGCSPHPRRSERNTIHGDIADHELNPTIVAGELFERFLAITCLVHSITFGLERPGGDLPHDWKEATAEAG